MVSKSFKKTASPPDSTGAPSRSTGTTAGITVGICLAVFVAATLLAMRQPPRPNPLAPASPGEKFLFPYEENGFMRLPMVTGTFNDLFAIETSGHVWAVGNDGLILASPDNGRSWQRLSLPQRKTRSPRAPTKPFDMKVLTSETPWGLSVSNAWAAAPPKNPRNKGEDVRQSPLPQQQQKTLPVPATLPEQKIAPPPAPELPPHLRTIFFIDETTGWMAGSDGAILSTSDGGTTWTFQQTVADADFYAIHFTDRETGWACGEASTLMSTTDGGRTWKKRSPDLFYTSSRSVFFLDRSHGWLCGLGGAIRYTEDGGNTWYSATSEDNDNLLLFSVFFQDTKNGWACGGSGRLFSSKDGGKTWDRVESGTSEDLYRITFSDPTHGFVSGAKGTLLATVDGGRTWISRNQKTRSDLAAVRFSDSRTGWACGKDGILLSTADGGKHWQPGTAGAATRLTSLFFTDRGYGWISGDGGTILFSQDGGRTWTPQESGTSGLLNAVFFSDRNNGWACGETGYHILLTRNGGNTWQNSGPTPGSPLFSVHFSDRSFGWICGRFGLIEASKDGGKNWAIRSPVSRGGEMRSVFFIDSSTGWVAGSSGTLRSTRDGGKTWTSQNSGIKTDLTAICFVDSIRGWACGQKGVILATGDGGQTWQLRQSGTQAALTDIAFTDRNHGWTCGETGTLLITEDGGTTWEARDSGTHTLLTAVQFTDRDHGWISGHASTILLTTDGGRTWEKPAYRRLPAPWYWTLCGVLLLFSLFVVQRGNAPRSAGETVADLLASDRPLEAGDPDPLDFKSISSGLSRFISNVNTAPPLTIAVTGEWGTGKSSLMNLLYHDLKQRRFQPVWFNAWHHQKGEQLLASLYAQIREQAPPPLWHPAGFQFRLRLLFRRARRNRILFILLAFLFFAAVPVLSDVLKSFFSNGFLLMSYLADGQADKVRELLSLSALMSAVQDKWIGALIASPAVAIGLKAIQAFGLSPQSLLVLGTAGGSRKAGLNPGARSRFTQEFKDVAASLDLGAMVIFIDDLDRCSKENVVEILETINFLAVSGNCFIILGMARQWVETCVALQFKELAEETGNDRKGRPEDGFYHRQRFARQYLEKLINIEVPVPTPSPDAAKTLLAPQPPDPPSPMERILGGIRKTFKRYLPLLCLLGLASLAWHAQDFFRLPSRGKPATQKQDLLVLPPTSHKADLLLQDGQISIPLNTADTDSRPLEIVIKGRADDLEKGISIGTLGSDERGADLILRYKQVPEDRPSGTLSPKVPVNPRDKTTPQAQGAAAFQEAERDNSLTGHLLALLVGIMLAVIGLIYLAQRPKRFTSDSMTFREALVICHPWIVLIHRTPRTIKRFLNRLRYVAMRLGAEPPRTGVWQHLKTRLAPKKTSPAPVPRETIPEAVLVALGAIYHVNPAWVKDPDTLRKIFTSQDLAEELTRQMPGYAAHTIQLNLSSQGLVDAIQEFKRVFGKDIDDMIQHREGFLAVLAETGI